MAELFEASRLTFFVTRKYEFDKSFTFDASCSPRPTFCLALLLEGEAVFHDCERECEDIVLTQGDMILVPVASRYISKWSGDPHVTYITLHFLFDYHGIFTQKKNFQLQKYTPDDFSKMREKYEYILEHQNGREELQLGALCRFFDILGTILPHLTSAQRRKTDARIEDAVAYIEQHYTENISVEDLAAAANMSASRFYPVFREALGVTPVDYINHYRINRAIMLLSVESEKSIEEISMSVGFESSTYFRRVFKKITGKSPKEYRKIDAEF